VRNPNWDGATDDNRAAYADGIQIKINSNVDDSFNALQNGDLDVVQGTPPVAVLQDFETNPDFQGWLHADQGDRTWYVTMNLLAPPFDDIHVRNAVNLALDKAGIRKAYGGDKRGELATSVEPPTVLPQSQDINTFAANTGAGDPTSAMDEMKQSRYDTNKNGICDDGGACDNILFLGRSTDPWPNMNQVAVASLKPILPGLDLKEVDTSTGYTTLQQVKKLIPISMVPGWGKDYASPYGFDFFIFDSAGIACWSVDDKMKECVAKPADQVDACFAELDTYLMTTAVPWAPWLWATQFTSTNLNTVTSYAFDQNAGIISYVNTSVNNGLAPVNVA